MCAKKYGKEPPEGMMQRMALTRKMLKAMGISEEQIEQIIEAHSETVDGLKDKLDDLKDQSAKLKAAEKELSDLKEAHKNNEDHKKKYDELKADYDKYKSETAAKETQKAKEEAARAYFKSKNISGSNLEIALRGCRDEISSLEMEDGKIKSTKALDELISGTFSGLVSKSGEKGVEVPTPPSGKGGKMTKADIYAKDDRGRYKLSAEERQKAIIENASEFGGNEE